MIIKKVKCKWAKVYQPDTKFEPVWTIDLYVDKAQAKELKAAGLKTKENEEGEVYYTAKRKVLKTDKTGNEYENTPPKVRDAMNKPFTDLIGNDSLVNAIINVFPWKNKFGSGIGAELVGVQVLNHVSYEPDEDFNEEEEFAANPEDIENDDPF